MFFEYKNNTLLVMTKQQNAKKVMGKPKFNLVLPYY